MKSNDTTGLVLVLHMERGCGLHSQDCSSTPSHSSAASSLLIAFNHRSVIISAKKEYQPRQVVYLRPSAICALKQEGDR
jgi:hypothetical protein